MRDGKEGEIEWMRERIQWLTVTMMTERDGEGKGERLTVII